MTGGFGEDSCAACHFAEGEADGGASLTVTGLPGTYEAGERYRLEVVLHHPGMAVAGFQLALRFAKDTTQAGDLAVPEDERSRVGIVVERGIRFAQHRPAGIELVAPDTARWRVDWIAPPPRGVVLLHVSGLAGDGDASQLGDHVYTVELGSEAR